MMRASHDALLQASNHKNELAEGTSYESSRGFDSELSVSGNMPTQMSVVPNGTVASCVLLSTMVLLSLCSITCLMVFLPNQTFTWLVYWLDYNYKML